MKILSVFWQFNLALLIAVTPGGGRHLLGFAWTLLFTQLTSPGINRLQNGSVLADFWQIVEISSEIKNKFGTCREAVWDCFANLRNSYRVHKKRVISEIWLNGVCFYSRTCRVYRVHCRHKETFPIIARHTLEAFLRVSTSYERSNRRA